MGPYQGVVTDLESFHAVTTHGGEGPLQFPWFLYLKELELHTQCCGWASRPAVRQPRRGARKGRGRKICDSVGARDDLCREFIEILRNNAYTTTVLEYRGCHETDRLGGTAGETSSQSDHVAAGWQDIPRSGSDHPGGLEFSGAVETSLPARPTPRVGRAADSRAPVPVDRGSAGTAAAVAARRRARGGVHHGVVDAETDCQTDRDPLRYPG